MKLSVRSYSELDAGLWDAFCVDSIQGTLMHTRRFLSYHGARFQDCSVVIERDGKLIGLMPAAVDRSNSGLVVSHPGATYGGIIHQGGITGGEMLVALDEIRAYYAKLGFSELLYKAVPMLYHQTPAHDDMYAFFSLGAELVRCDLSSSIDLTKSIILDNQRRRGLKRAEKANVHICEGTSYLPEFWKILTNNLLQKHGVSPVHTLEEITHLAKQFPNEIRCVSACIDGAVVAGSLLFVTPTAIHAQYIANNENGKTIGALDKLFLYCIETASALGKRWFDFGISTENQGRLLNDGLYRFKSGFGSGGTIHSFYKLKLHK